MEIKTDPELIWKWHKIIEKKNLTGLSVREICKEEGVKSNSYTYFRHRIIWKSECSDYSSLIEIIKAYPRIGMSRNEFARKHHIPVNVLGDGITHLSYLKVLEELKQAKEGKMNFIAIKPPEKKVLMQTPDEELIFIEGKNDIELKISKGVKVVVSPEVTSEKLIKIIELLKDL